MRPLWLFAITIAIGCAPPPTTGPDYPTYPEYQPDQGSAPARPPSRQIDPETFGQIDSTQVDFQFEGGKLEFELRREGDHVVQIARNRYAVPVTIAFTLSDLDNVSPISATSGVVVLPPASAPLGKGPAKVLGELTVIDPSQPYRRNLGFRARFGDPRSRAQPYGYRLPYKRGLAFAVLQGFHGAFSHRGSNEFAVDFNCPVATQVVASRPGVVVATNASALGSGTTAEFLDYTRVNFVLVLHDDGTLGEYMHLAPSGVLVAPGQRVERGQDLALSGNTGYSSTPHLHFQVMTAATDGIAARSFPFRFAVTPERALEPVQGDSYLAWE